MTTWANTATGELYEGECPRCAQAEDEAAIQVQHMERELRSMRSKVTKMERQIERDEVKKRDGAMWKRILSAWLEAFPDKRPTAKGVKSARATKVFLRLEAGAAEDDILDAIRGAQEYPYVVFGKRQKRGSASDLADDLEDIVALKRDKEFDFLREAGVRAKASEPVF